MLIDQFRQDPDTYMPYINTGTLIDYGTGSFHQGLNQNWVLNGGLSVITAITGRAQTYKSGSAGSMLTRSLLIHPDAEAIVIETEGSMQDASRYDDFAPINTPVSPRIAFYPSSTSLGDADALLEKLCVSKIKQKKDLVVPSPFLNLKTGKPYMMWIPTFVMCDSFSRIKSDKADKLLAENQLDSSGTNTYWLTEGGDKTKFMTQLAKRCQSAGIYMIMTAHIGDNQSLSHYAAPKQLPHMKGNDKLKYVGSQFEFLATTLIQTTSAEVLRHKTSKDCFYPDKHSTDMEVNEIMVTMVRGKNNATGYQLPLIISQYQGILDAVTYHVYLRKNENYGLDVRGNNERFSPKILNSGDNASAYYHRKTLRDMTNKDYELLRALELTAQLCFIRSKWNTRNLPDYILTNPEELADKLKNTDKAIISRILNSSGSWTTNPKPEREVLTILDVLSILHNPKA